jgi:glyoxylase-like metal-dependent hydrolase (beta-lactamase superfamily II)
MKSASLGHISQLPGAIQCRANAASAVPPGKEQWMWVPTWATLIYGRRDAVLVDAFLTVEQAYALVEWVAASGKNLTMIYVTHGHADHFFGIGGLQNRFPNAKAVATPLDTQRARHRDPGDLPEARRPRS